MDFGVGSFLFAFLAGVLSTLSPCVLPLIPIIIGAATNQHRLGPLALAGGLTLSFAVIGTALASLGSSIGIAQDGFRLFAAIIMGLIGIVLSDGHFYRVGGHDSLRANVRVIAATHQNLEERVAQGLFREDLLS